MLGNLMVPSAVVVHPARCLHVEVMSFAMSVDAMADLARILEFWRVGLLSDAKLKPEPNRNGMLLAATLFFFTCTNF
jgi:hypothetical protein